jgi:hypothetical protein
MDIQLLAQHIAQLDGVEHVDGLLGDLSFRFVCANTREGSRSLPWRPLPTQQHVHRFVQPMLSKSGWLAGRAAARRLVQAS